MEIDVMGWIKKSLKPPMVEEGSALKGRDTPILNPIPRHTVLSLPLDEVPEGCEVIYFAMGCYWGEERLFWKQDGVVNTAVGFMGGFTPNPTYRESCGGQTGHAETVQVVFDPKLVSFSELLAVFWENHDPTQGARQGNDVGTEYRSAIFPTSDAQLEAATRSRDSYQEKMTEAGYGTITTEITPDLPFYYAEKEHQQYLDKNPGGYCPVHSTGVACD